MSGVCVSIFRPQKTSALLIAITALSIIAIPPRAPAVFSSVSWQTIDYDPTFSNSEQHWVNHLGTLPYSNDNFSYWRPTVAGNQTGCPQTGFGTATISGGVFHSNQNNTQSTSFSCNDISDVDQGNFPSQTGGRGCAATSNQTMLPDFTCPRNEFGLRDIAHSDFRWTNLTVTDHFISRNTPNSTTALYNSFVDLYWWFNNGPVTANSSHCANGSSCTKAWVETMVKLSAHKWQPSNSSWIDQAPIGATTTCDCHQAFLFSVIATDVQPGQTLTLTGYNMTQVFSNALAAWNISANTHAVLLGIAVGTEGYGSVLKVDFSNVYVGTDMSPIARADIDFDHTINILDLAYVSTFFDRCPNNRAKSGLGYSWLGNVASEALPDPSPPNFSGDACINIIDLSTTAFFWQQNY